ncbi:MAG: GTP-binding protein [Betaproteobacteria bacterium]|nr:GTP-binding protein [Betaproteobacteria bacterium]MBI2509979.1 GTP-binding protein [Betaproteobacteria bacterium]
MAARVPVSLITGFLGSGKTTLLNRLLRDPGFANAAVIINEFGEIALDHLLVAAPSENTVLLANGCICCTVRGDLTDTLAGLARKRDGGELPRFDRVLIETTGLADPVPVLQTLITDEATAPHYRLDSVVTLIDGVHGANQLDTHAEAVKQAALADRLLITKCDRAGADVIAALERRLDLINPAAVRSRAVRGDVGPQALFGAALHAASADDGRFTRWLAPEAVVAAETHHDGHAHDDGISAFCVHLDQPVARTGLILWLNFLAGMRGANLLRVKGLLNVEGRPVAVHAVQTLIDEPVELARWPDAERRSRLVFITRDLPRAAIEKTLSMLAFDAAAPRGTIDPQAYARFAAAAQNFL